ncbi:hypothetical protein SRRS_06590 [Sporomusa rhizae]
MSRSQYVRRHSNDIKPSTKYFPTRLEEYAIIVVQAVGERLATSFWEGGGMVSTFEAMYLMVAFATLVVLIIKQK